MVQNFMHWRFASAVDADGVLAAIASDCRNIVAAGRRRSRQGYPCPSPMRSPYDRGLHVIVAYIGEVK